MPKDNEKIARAIASKEREDKFRQALVDMAGKHNDPAMMAAATSPKTRVIVKGEEIAKDKAIIEELLNNRTRRRMERYERQGKDPSKAIEENSHGSKFSDEDSL